MKIDETIQKLIELKIIPTKKNLTNKNDTVISQSQFQDNNVQISLKNKIQLSERFKKKQSQLILKEDNDDPQYFGPNHRRRGSQKQISTRNNSSNKKNNVLHIEKQKENLDQLKQKSEKQLIKSMSKHSSPLRHIEINQFMHQSGMPVNNFNRSQSSRFILDI